MANERVDAPLAGTSQRAAARPGRVARLVRALTEPAPTILEAEHRRRARLLAALLLVLAPLALVSSTALPMLTDPAFSLAESRAAEVGVAAGLVLLFAYGFARTDRPVLGAIITVVVAVVAAWVASAANARDTGDFSAFTFLVIPVMLSSMLLSLEYTVAVAVLAVGGVAVTKLLIPDAPTPLVTVPFIFVTMTSAIVIVFASIRERDLRDLARRASELARSNRELEQYAYVASHDLQEPLRQVASYVQLLEKRYKGKLDADADDFIHFAVDGADRMKRLIQDLMTHASAGSPEMLVENVPLEVVLRSAMERLGPLIAETGTVVTNEPLPVLRAEPERMTLLFRHLLENAIKFRRPDAPPRIHLRAEDRGTEWLFALTDNGIGIEEQYQDKLFVLFRRLHGPGEYPGTGIGLALCRRIVERHGGRIWVTSRRGEGATFWFTIPHALPAR